MVSTACFIGLERDFLCQLSFSSPSGYSVSHLPWNNLCIFFSSGKCLLSFRM